MSRFQRPRVGNSRDKRRAKQRSSCRRHRLRTSDYVLYKHGRPMQAGVIPIGGDHITNDLSYGIRLSRANSERIKRHCGKATITEDEKSEKFWSFGDKQIGDKKISMDAINKVIRARLEELFLLLRDELNDFMGNDSIKEVVLTGGTSNLIGICELASAVLGIPCSQGKFDSSVRPNLRHQEFATALGLLEYRVRGSEVSPILPSSTHSQNFQKMSQEIPNREN
ncbi:MAG: cell division FtsA domain-containing protein [Bacilli bacterium]